VCADALTLDRARVGTFDLIVSLETIEHVAQPEKLLDVFKALLNPAGLLALSCPNDQQLGAQNPFHHWVAEFEELRSWLTARFAHVHYYGEVHLAGTAVWPQRVMEERADPGQEHVPRVRLIDSLPMASAAGFLMACGQQPPPSAEARGALLLDGSAYVRNLERTCGELWAEAQNMAAERRAREEHTRALEKENVELYEEAKRVAAGWQEQTARVVVLEEEKQRMSEEAARLATAWEKQTARVHELDEMKDRLWNELQEVASEHRALVRDREQLENRLRIFERWLPCRLLRRIGLLKPVNSGSE
jgi:SAM-dependent methyltransferase